jgi:hypothetical protein
MVFLFQRVVTFIIGVLLIVAMFLIWKFSDTSIVLYIGIIPFSLMGVYFIAAPHRRTTRDITDLAMDQVFIELPVWLVGRILNRISDWL